MMLFYIANAVFQTANAIWMVYAFFFSESVNLKHLAAAASQISLIIHAILFSYPVRRYYLNRKQAEDEAFEALRAQNLASDPNAMAMRCMESVSGTILTLMDAYETVTTAAAFMTRKDGLARRKKELKLLQSASETLRAADEALSRARKEVSFLHRALDAANKPSSTTSPV